MIYLNITNTFTQQLRTGIQRVVVNLCEQLTQNKQFVPIAFDHKNKIFTKITDFTKIDRAIYQHECKQVMLHFSDFNAGDSFFDIDAAWGDNVDRHVLYPALKEKGVFIINLHYDSVPLVNAAWSHKNTVLRYMRFFEAKIAYSDFIFSISDFVKNEMDTLSSRLMGIKKAGAVIPMGALPVPKSADSKAQNKYAFVLKKPYFIAVGTLEPRKNYELLLKVFEENPFDAHLIIVGRKGWNIDALIRQLEQSPLYNKRIFWLSDVNDAELAFLYAHAHAYITASHYEGYGLPAIEALSFAIPTIVSDGGALPEVVGNTAEVFSLSNPAQLAAIMKKLLVSTDYVAELTKKANSYQSPSWQEAATVIETEIKKMRVKIDFEARLKQIVYISIAPEKFKFSLASMKKNVCFIESVVVLTKQSLKDEFSAICQSVGMKYHILCDEDILSETELEQKDHLTRNTCLRRRLYSQSIIDVNFLASDDDYLAISNIDRTFFQQNNQHCCYYFYEHLENWLGAFPKRNSFDKGLMKTGRFLRGFGFGQKAFQAHMPQIINKALVTSIFEKYLADPRNANVDEWSLYFNIARYYHPENFIVKPYETFSWPGSATAWVTQLLPKQFSFQNYYAPDEAIHGYSKIVNANDSQLNVYKQLLHEVRAQEIHEKPLMVNITPSHLVFSNETILMKAGRKNFRRVLLQNTSESPLKNIKITLHPKEPLQNTKQEYFYENVDTLWFPLYPPDALGVYTLTVELTLADTLLKKSMPLTVTPTGRM